MRLIRFIAKHSRRMLLSAVAAGVIGGAASVALLFVIDSGLSHGGAGSKRLILIFVGLAALAMITRATSALLLTYIGQSALFRLRVGLSHQILGVPLRRLEEVGSPRLLGILTDDIPNIINAVANIPLICVNVAGLLTCLIFLAYLSWPLFLVVLVLIVLGVITYQLPFLAATKHFQLARKEHNNVLGHLRSLIQGVKELKANRKRRKAFLGDMLESSASQFQKHSMSAMKIYVLGATWGEMLSFLTIGALVFVAPLFMHLDTAVITGFVLVLIYMMEPIEFILNQLPQISKASVALKSIEEVGLALSKDGTEEDPAVEIEPKPTWKKLELIGVGFSYEREDGEGRFILGPIDLTIKPGDVVFLTGGNGSGKTTLAKVLLGLYTPDQGGILLDGRPVTKEDRDNFRQYFSAIFSDFYLFDRLLGIEKTGIDEKAGRYLEQLRLNHKVNINGGAISTIDLSQGQRKRLALLTAYMEDRPMFLFDEWAADQDPAFKDIFYCQLLPELKAKGKAVFVITHDDRYYDVADRVIKLDNGQIVDDRHLEERSTRQTAV